MLKSIYRSKVLIMININIRTLMPVREEPSTVVRHSSLTGMLTYSSSIHASPLPQTTCDKILEQILGTLKQGGIFWILV